MLQTDWQQTEMLMLSNYKTFSVWIHFNTITAYLISRYKLIMLRLFSLGGGGGLHLCSLTLTYMKFEPGESTALN